MSRLLKTSSPAGIAGRNRRRDSGAPAFFLLPFFILFALTILAPVLYAAGLSLFTEQRSGLGFGGAETVFVGLGNYAEVLTSESFLAGFGRVAIYCALYIPTMIGGALLIALLIDSIAARARQLFQVLVFLPHAVPGVVAALIWIYLYTPGVSPIVQGLSALGAEVDFLSEAMIIPSIVNLSVWEWTGYNVIIFYTALQAIPRDILEAARVDGASEIRSAFVMKLPLIAPAIGVSLLFTVIGTMQLFTQPHIMKLATSAITSAWVPNLWVYDAAFNRLNLNDAAAASVIIALLAGGLSFLVTRLNSWMTR